MQNGLKFWFAKVKFDKQKTTTAKSLRRSVWLKNLNTLSTVSINNRLQAFEDEYLWNEHLDLAGSPFWFFFAPLKTLCWLSVRDDEGSRNASVIKEPSNFLLAGSE